MMIIDIDTYAKVLGLEADIRVYRRPKGIRILYSYAHTETKRTVEDAVLASSYGEGATIYEAKKDYARQIAGKILVINGYQSTRREFVAPEALGVFVQPEDTNIDARAHRSTQLDDFLRAENLSVVVKMLPIEHGGGVSLSIPSHGFIRASGIAAIVATGQTLDEAREKLCSILQSETLRPMTVGNIIHAPLTMVATLSPDTPTFQM